MSPADDPSTAGPRVAVVTGAGQGIGLGIAGVLHEHGHAVVLVDRNRDRVERAAEGIGPRATTVVADVSTEDGAASLAAAVVERHGRWDVLVNNAAALRLGALQAMSLPDWDTVLRGTLTTAWLCTRAAAGPMRRAGHGRIINITSIVAQGAPSDDLIAYTAAKSGVEGLTLAAARELGPDGITVNAVSPGAVVTDAWLRFPDPDALRATRAASAAVRRVGDPAEIGAAVAYLASPEAGFVTGQTLVVDGGRLDKL